jgi:uncharacterized membrane protein YphA (DoxX/SURF4 family)
MAMLPQPAPRLPRDVGRPLARPAPAPGRTARRTLQVAYATLALAAGADKFFNALASWQTYLAPDIPDLLGVAPWSLMHAAGVVEIVIGLLVALQPALGGWLLAVWLWMVAGNLLILPGYHDVVLRDLVLSLGAVALALLAARARR